MRTEENDLFRVEPFRDVARDGLDGFRRDAGALFQRRNLEDVWRGHDQIISDFRPVCRLPISKWLHSRWLVFCFRKTLQISSIRAAAEPVSSARKAFSGLTRKVSRAVYGSQKRDSSLRSE